MNPVQYILIMLVRIYRVTLSPAKTFLFGPAGGCRFEPSCSQYAIEAVRTHGTFSGCWLAAKRICRCHPWGQCGEDPVPPVKSKIQLAAKQSAVGGPTSTVGTWIKSPVTRSSEARV